MWLLPRGTRAAARSLQPARTILQPRRDASHTAEPPADSKAKIETELQAAIEASSANLNAQEKADLKAMVEAERRGGKEASSANLNAQQEADFIAKIEELQASSANLNAQQKAGPSHTDDHSHDSHGHGESALHLKDANASGSESMGSGFYTTLAAVPLFYIGYILAFGSEDNVFARYYQSYKEGTQDSADRDKLHQTVVQQAILDRARLSSYPRETSGPDLNWPEMFNAGSPWNQAVGQGADLRQLEEYYRKVRDQAEEERVARMQSGRSMSAYDPPPLSK